MHDTHVVHDRCHGVEPPVRVDAEPAAVHRPDRGRLVVRAAHAGQRAQGRVRPCPLGGRGAAVERIERLPPGGPDVGEPDVLVAYEPVGGEHRVEKPAFPGHRLLGVAEGVQRGQVAPQSQVADIVRRQIRR